MGGKRLFLLVNIYNQDTGNRSSQYVQTAGRDVVQPGTYGGCAEKLYVVDKIFKPLLPSQLRLQEGEGLKGSNMPSGLLRAVTHPIYLYLWPLRSLCIEIRDPESKTETDIKSLKYSNDE